MSDPVSVTGDDDGRPRWDAGAIRQRLRDSGFPVEGELPPVAWFGDSAPQARELGELVRAGRKTATAGLLWKWDHDGRPTPRPGDRQLIVDWDGRPLAVIEMADVRIVPFDEVDETFAREEGEGDRSLAYWRDVHGSFFARECARIGRHPTPAMPVLCMRFRLLHAVAG